MGKIIWSNAFSVQSKYLDHQHQNLVTIVNDFNQAVARGEGAKMASCFHIFLCLTGRYTACA